MAVELAKLMDENDEREAETVSMLTKYVLCAFLVMDFRMQRIALGGQDRGDS